MRSPFDLSGRKALITGASRGIGRAIAVAFAEAGADVALVARTAEALEETAAAVRVFGREAVVLPCDVTEREAVGLTCAAAVEALGHVDVVVNNAGGTRFLSTFADTRLSGWDKTMALNLDSAMAVCHALAPHLFSRGDAAVINVASTAAFGAPFVSSYAAAKGALIALTKSLALEWAADGVRVNALCPGWTATDLNRPLWSDPQTSASTIANVPLGRWGTPEEMAAPAVFLASRASSYMTGQVLVVDGGQTTAS
ncbi:SDR family NAD(P)-dependent oxidoreductase [Bailinhaonella thermotolerans]|uniref:Glucose 1-dehydrogenase n=1 Tax=Bailinhaonella thermotolerans TaxID=1070861 RepID=A0A3A4A8W3_9ACTN|nr:glucose 1-dehydrogenase [Bailinhaonella thermotolerans]RJL24521.1 glucose 1-dehydrogenase [Bailinhaonella thermotolerans]